MHLACKGAVLLRSNPFLGVYVSSHCHCPNLRSSSSCSSAMHHNHCERHIILIEMFDAFSLMIQSFFYKSGMVSVALLCSASFAFSLSFDAVLDCQSEEQFVVSGPAFLSYFEWFEYHCSK